MSDERVNRAVRGLKHCGPFYYRPGDEPNSLDCSLAGRVSHVFLVGMTSAIQMCRDAGEDPNYQEQYPPLCCECGADAECLSGADEYRCGDCCTHDGEAEWCSLSD